MTTPLVTLHCPRLTVISPEPLLPLLQGWLPLHSLNRHEDNAGTITLRHAAIGDPPADAPALKLANTNAWIDASSARLHAPACSGLVDLVQRIASIDVEIHDDADAISSGIFSTLTLAAAFLLARAGSSLAHAGAIAKPDGGAWLLIGDTHAGKSTTTINAVRGGWRFLSDDQVVLSRSGTALIVEGWPRHFHLDPGWQSGTPGTARDTVDPRAIAPHALISAAPLAGLLFPRVQAEQPTRIEPVAASDALARLIRQSPWVLADRAVSANILELLAGAAQLPAFELQSGLDSYRDPAILHQRLAEL